VFAVDTNVLVYAANVRSPAHDRCRSLLEDWRSQASAWFLTWGIVYEFLRVSTPPRVFQHPLSAANAWSFVEAIMTSPGLSMLTATERHAEIAATVIEEIPFLSGNLMHDAETAILMREHGIKTIYTRDTDFHRFPFVEPIDPLR